jgi:3-oxoacyl-[acyl-carrier protein] reductase
MLDIHVNVPIRILRAASSTLCDLSRGYQRKVVNVSSISGTMGVPGQVNYDAAKAAVLGLTKGLAKEWGPHGVNVNAVAPGFIDTRLTAPQGSGEQIEIGGHVIPIGIEQTRRSAITELVPLGRAGRPSEVAHTVLFLCLPWSDYIHGQVISVTGGVTLGMSG